MVEQKKLDVAKKEALRCMDAIRRFAQRIPAVLSWPTCADCEKKTMVPSDIRCISRTGCCGDCNVASKNP